MRGGGKGPEGFRGRSREKSLNTHGDTSQTSRALSSTYVLITLPCSVYTGSPYNGHIQRLPPDRRSRSRFLTRLVVSGRRKVSWWRKIGASCKVFPCVFRMSSKDIKWVPNSDGDPLFDVRRETHSIKILTRGKQRSRVKSGS